MENSLKVFKVVAGITISVTLTAAILSIIGVVITGFYPGIMVFIFLALISIAFLFFAKKNVTQTRAFYVILSILNLLVVLIVIWMTFVIMIDRVIPNL